MQDFRTNIIDKGETKEYISEVLNELNKSLSLSLGPYGSTTIIQSNQMGHYMTKDGFTILKAIRFNEPIMNTLLTIIQEASTQLVLKVGDGSTTSIIASNYIYKELTRAIDNGTIRMRPKNIVDSMNRVIEMLVKELEKLSTPVSDYMIELDRIASVSTNNDMDMGKMIGDIYREAGKEGFINIKLGNTTKTHYTKSNGFQIDFGYLDKILVNTSTDECKLDNANVLMFNATVTEDYLPLIETAIRKVLTEDLGSLVIMAPGYSSEMSTFFREFITYNFSKSQMKNRFNIIKFPLATEHDQNSFGDLAIKLGAKIVQNALGDMPPIENVVDLFGKADEVVSSYKITSFIGSKGCPNQISIRIGNIKNELALLEENGIYDNAKTYELRKRLAVLEDKLFTIFVGGNSEHSRTADKYLIEDAVAACKSAIKHGYVIGCNLSIAMAIQKCRENAMLVDDSIMMDVIASAFYNVFKTVLANKYGDDEELINGIYNKCVAEGMVYDLIRENYTNTDIINSVETEVEILRNVTSIISLLVSSNQFVSFNTK